MPRAWARSRTYFLMLRSLRPSLRQIQPCWSAKPRQRSLAMWAGILGWPFSQATSRQKNGQHCSEGRARAAEIFFQTAAGQRWACRTTSRRGVPNSPWRVSCSQKRGEGSSSPQWTWRSQRLLSPWALTRVSRRACKRRLSGQTRKEKPGLGMARPEFWMENDGAGKKGGRHVRAFFPRNGSVR